MNFLEICQRVLDIADRDGAALTDVKLTSTMDPMHKKVILIVQEQYAKIQRDQDFWNFHHKAGKFLTLSSGIRDYTKSGVRSTQDWAWLARKVGETTTWQVCPLSYDEWIRDWAHHAVPATGQPKWIVELPNEKWRVEPTPDAAYEVLGDWWSTNDIMQNKSDEPLWHEDYHMLLVWLALQEFQEEFDAAELEKRIARNLPALARQFRRQYLRPIENPGVPL